MLMHVTTGYETSTLNKSAWYPSLQGVPAPTHPLWLYLWG